MYLAKNTLSPKYLPSIWRPFLYFKRHLQCNLLLTLILVLTFSSAKAQFGILDPTQIPKIKTGKTYILMQDPSSLEAQPFIEVFKRYWTFSSFEIISYEDVSTKIKPGVFFFGIDWLSKTVTNYRVDPGGYRRPSLTYDFTHFFLSISTYSDKFFNKEEKKRDYSDRSFITRTELYTDFFLLEYPDSLRNLSYDGDQHIYNWSPGILKNYIQQLMRDLEKGEKRSLYTAIYDQEEISKLKEQTLYVPDYILTKFSKMSGKEDKKHEESEIFKDYPHQYKLVSSEKLNEMILQEAEPFYYLLYLKSSTDKYLTVINSQTGKIVYSFYYPISYNIEPADLKDLAREIKLRNK